jgi:prepilin-type N-terminal cleavage/methylation domain-containing protein
MTPALPSSTRVPEVRSEGGFARTTEASSLTPDAGLARSSVGPLPAFVNVIVNVNEQPTFGRAFSLIELLAVVGIIAILSVAAVPVMRGLGGSQSSRATASILVSALEQARTAAILSGTNAYLALPDANTTTMTTTNVDRSYAIIRPKVDLDGDNRDDFQTNFTANWILLSKWERLPGDIVFDSPRLARHILTNPAGLPFPGNSAASPLRVLGFNPSGGLAEATGTNGLLFYSQAKSNVVDGIKISFYSGRVQYVGIVTNTNTF